MIRFLPHSAAKAQQWEITKGHLRALVVIDAAVSTDERPFRFEKTSEAVEKFIRDFEDAGLHEGWD